MTFHVSPRPFRRTPADEVCIFCSDGRFVSETVGFLESRLGLLGPDLMVVPGGAASLSGHPAAWRDAEVVGEGLRFLQRAHDLSRAVLIAHEDCGFYAGRLGVGPGEMERQQLEDLRRAASRLRVAVPAVTVEAYFARVDGDRVRFEPVEL